MKYDNRLKNIWLSAAQYESHYAIQAVMIDAKKKVAVVTDSHCMAIVDVKPLLEPEEVGFLIPVDALKAAMALYGQQKRYAVKLRKDIFIRKVGDAVIVSVGKSNRSQSFDAENGRYPDWEKVVPNVKDYKLGIALSVDILRRLTASLNGNWDRDHVVELYVKDETSPIIVSSSNQERANFGALMPCRAGLGMPKQFWLK